MDLDLTSVARIADADGIAAMVQLLVGAAVSCQGKADYIQAIMQARRRGCGEGGTLLAAFGLRHQGAGGNASRLLRYLQRRCSICSVSFETPVPKGGGGGAPHSLRRRWRREGKDVPRLERPIKAVGFSNPVLLRLLAFWPARLLQCSF